MLLGLFIYSFIVLSYPSLSMTVTDDYANTLNYMLGTKTIRTNPGRFARRDCYIFY